VITLLFIRENYFLSSKNFAQVSSSTGSIHFFFSLEIKNFMHLKSELRTELCTIKKKSYMGWNLSKITWHYWRNFLTSAEASVKIWKNLLRNLFVKKGHKQVIFIISSLLSLFTSFSIKNSLRVTRKPKDRMLISRLVGQLLASIGGSHMRMLIPSALGGGGVL
jgi:hypothetical protein